MGRSIQVLSPTYLHFLIYQIQRQRDQRRFSARAEQMELICNAYSSSSGDEEEAQHVPKPEFPLSKRIKTNPTLDGEAPAPIEGRYVSKRERALLGCIPPSTAAEPPQPSAAKCIVLGAISNSAYPQNVTSLLRRQAKGHVLDQLPEKLSSELCGHTKAVNAVHWSPSHSHLLASAGMDQTICIWNVWSKDQKKARVLNFHNAAVKDVKWSPQGLFLLSCGYDFSSRIVDVEKGIETQVLKEDQMVNVVKFHPDNSHLFLSGGSKGHIRLWDTRNGKAVHEYVRGLGPVLDLEFMVNRKQFISSSDVSGSNISENSIIVWDVSREVALSNQVYVEAYTCPCVRCHPCEPFFVAQSNGNYIAIFSTRPPYKLDKYKRYESHGVSGFPIRCNFSLDGEKLVSGSSDGSIYFYNYRSSEMVKKIKAYEEACIDVAFHPSLPNVIASCSWKGNISIFE